MEKRAAKNRKTKRKENAKHSLKPKLEREAAMSEAEEAVGERLVIEQETVKDASQPGIGQLTAEPERGAEAEKKRKETEKKREEARVDEEVEESFPASDPPSFTPTGGA